MLKSFLVKTNSFIRNYQIPINQLKKGDIISHKDKIWSIANLNQHSQGRQGAHYKVELKDIITGSKGLERFNSGTFVNGVELTEKKLRFSYADELLHLFDPETFEEHELPLDIIDAGKNVLPFLYDEMIFRVQYHNNTPLVAKIPEKGTYKVSETTQAIKAGTSDSNKGMGFKAAKVEGSDAQIQVPEFINIGDEIIVSLVDLKYLQRVSNKS